MPSTTRSYLVYLKGKKICTRRFKDYTVTQVRKLLIEVEGFDKRIVVASSTRMAQVRAEGKQLEKLAQSMSRRATGRPHTAPGTPSQRYQVSIPSNVADGIRGLGKGSLSRGIVRLSIMTSFIAKRDKIKR
jgi:hypothetical protein